MTLRWPGPGVPGPADGLWQHTCCEAFVGDGQGRYHEFNASPSGQWAVYRFSGVRQRDLSHRPPVPPALDCMHEGDQFRLQVRLPLPLLPVGSPLRLGLCAVLEHADGRHSHWALRHDCAQPDFHQPATFLIALDSLT